MRATAELDADLTKLVRLLVGHWSSGMSLPPDAETLQSPPAADFVALRESVFTESPERQRAVHPAPGWRRR